MADLSKLSNEDLQAISSGDMSKVSTEGLQYITQQPKKTEGTVTIGGVEVKKPTAVVGPAIGGALGELVKGAGAIGELVTPEKYQQYPKKVTEMGQSMVDLANQFNPVTATVGQIGSYALPQAAGTKAMQAVVGTPSNLISKMAQQAGVGGAIGSAMTPGNAEDRTTSGTINAVLGGVAPAAGALANKLYQGGKSVIEPLYEQGKNAILARALRSMSGGEPEKAIANLQASRPTVEGSLPTVGQASGVPSLAATERALIGASPEATNMLANRQALNAQARTKALENIATPTRVEKYTNLRETVADDLYDKAINKQMDFATLNPDLQKQIGSLIQSPSIKKAMTEARKNALDKGIDIGRPEGSLKGLHQTKLALDDEIAKLNVIDPTSAQKARKDALLGAKDRLLGFIEDVSPEYKVARETFARLSKPVNQLDEIAKLADKSVSPKENTIYADRFFKQLDKIKKENVLSKQQIARLEAIGEDLKLKSFAESAGRGVGSNTVQNLAYANMANQVGIPNMLRNMAGGQIIGNLAKRAGDVMYGKANRELTNQMAETMLSPQRAAELMQMPNVSKPLNTTATENLAKMLMLQQTTQGR